jgi:hypothetical protein
VFSLEPQLSVLEGILGVSGESATSIGTNDAELIEAACAYIKRELSRLDTSEVNVFINTLLARLPGQANGGYATAKLLKLAARTGL